MTAPKKAQQTKATRSGKAGRPECVLANAAVQVMATRYKTASGLYVVDLFDSLGTKLAQLCYDDQKYGLTFAPEAQFQFEYLDGFSVWNSWMAMIPMVFAWSILAANQLH
jgi:hypothetical protein